MRTVPFPFVGGAYADESRPWSMQDTVNYLPTLAERSGTRSQAMLKTPPGLRPYTRGSTGIVRGTYNAEGKFFAVIGTTFYQVMPGGLLVSKGVVPGLGRVAFTHNQISLGNEVVVVNGTAGYVYNTVTNTFGRITDPGYPGSAVAGFIDGYIIGIEPQGRYAFNSRPAAATDYNTLDRFTSEVSPDRLVTQGISNNELLLLSTTSGEFFQNTGASQQPFRSKRITIDKGCAGPYTLVDLDNSLCWLGGDGVFYRLENYTPKRISTRPIEQAIRGLDWWQAFGFVWEDSGYACAYWTFPDGRTWGWDASNGEWHRRESYQMDRWRANTMTRWNDDWYAGDFQDGMIWRVDWDYIMEGCQEFVSERTCAVMHDNQNRVRANVLELVMDVGQEITQIHDGFTISGSLPAGEIGDAVDFRYTLDEAYPGQAILTISAGALPTGLTMDVTGHVTGVRTEAGDFSWIVSGTDGCGTAEHEDESEVTEPPWIAAIEAANFDMQEVEGGDDWTTGMVDTNVVGGTASRLYLRDNGDILFTNEGIIGLRPFGGSWSSVGTMQNSAGMESCFAGGYWHVCRPQVARSATGASFETVGTAPDIKAIAAGEESLLGVDNVSVGRLWHANLQGDVWTQSGTLGTGLSPTNLCAGSGDGEMCVVKSAATGGTVFTEIFSSEDDGATVAPVALAFPDILQSSYPSSGTIRPIARYDSGLGLWVIASHTRVAYGPTLDDLEMSEHVFEDLIADVGSGGGKFIAAGNFGYMKSTNGADWEELPKSELVVSVGSILCIDKP